MRAGWAATGFRHGLGVGLTLLAGPALATSLSASPIGQDHQDHGVVSSDQIDPPGEPKAPTVGQVSQQPGTERAVPVKQVATPDGASATTSQLSNGERRVPVTPRASERDHATQASAPLSKASDGRNVATARLTGADRCDPQSARGGQSRICSHVIETRAESFANERPDLSPEQRLLAERYPREDRRGLMAEVRRVGRNDVDPASTDAQALAAVLQAQRAEEQAAAEKTANAQKVDPSVVNAVVNAINGGK